MSSEIAVFDLSKVATPLGIFALNHYPYYYGPIIYECISDKRHFHVWTLSWQFGIRAQKKVAVAFQKI